MKEGKRGGGDKHVLLEPPHALKGGKKGWGGTYNLMKMLYRRKGIFLSFA